MAGTWAFAVCLAALAVVWADEPTGSEPPPICQDHAINLTASEGRITSRPLFGGSSCCPTRQLRQNGYHSTGIACFWMLDNPPSGDFEVRFNLSGSRFSPGDALVFQAAWGRELGRIDGMPIHPFLISMPAHSANLGIRLQATSNQTTLKLHYRLRSVVRPDAADDDDEGVVDNCQGSPTLANPSCRQWDTDPIVRAPPLHAPSHTPLHAPLHARSCHSASCHAPSPGPRALARRVARSHASDCSHASDRMPPPARCAGTRAAGGADDARAPLLGAPHDGGAWLLLSAL